MPELRHTVETLLFVLDSEFGDEIQVICRDDGSTDGSSEFLASIKNENFRVDCGAASGSMLANWELLLHKVDTPWFMYLGQDDILLPSFGRVAFAALKAAKSRRVDAITFRRAYLNWSDDGSVESSQHFANKTRRMRSKSLALMSSLVGSKPYHFLPQAYTSSIFSTSLLPRFSGPAKGQMLLAHPQDASLVSIWAFSESKSYYFVGEPVSMVGTSSHSAGRAISESKNSRVSNFDLAEDYLSSVYSGHRPYPEWAGSFKISSTQLYLWQSLCQYAVESSSKLAGILESRAIKMVIVSRAMSVQNHDSGRDLVTELAKFHNLPLSTIRALSKLFSVELWIKRWLLRARILVARSVVIVMPRFGAGVLDSPIAQPFSVFWSEQSIKGL